MSEAEDTGEGVEEETPARHRLGGRKVKVPNVELLAEKLADVRRVRRPSKAPAVRHDAAPAPTDGDYDPLRLTNTNPAFEYFWASDRDRGRLGGRGWVEERWGPNCARPAFYYGNQVRDSIIKFNELTLLKLPRDVADDIRAKDPKRRQHAQLMREILTPSPNHNPRLTEQTLTGPTRS